MKSKFDVLFESNFTRFQGGGFLTGDVVKLKEDWENDDWSKNAPGQLVDQIKQLAESDLILRVSSVKAVRPTISSTVDQANQVDDFHVDIAQESAPGRYSGVFVTIPQHLIELNGANDTLPDIPDSLKRKENIVVEPEEVTVEDNDDQFANPVKQTGTDDKVNKTMTDKNETLPGSTAATSYTAGYMG